MPGWLHGVFVGEWLFVFPLCGFSLSLFCSYFILGVTAGPAKFLWVNGFSFFHCVASPFSLFCNYLLLKNQCDIFARVHVVLPL